MPVVTGNLRDVTSVPLVNKEPEIIFSLNAANSSGGNLYPTYPIVVTPNSNGDFYVSLEATVDMVDTGFYKMQIRFLAPSSQETTLIDFPDWRITVPRSGGSITTLLAGHNPGNQSMVWVSLTPPLMPRPFTLWLKQDPEDVATEANTGRLYEFRNGSWSEKTGRGAFRYIADLRGPAGYNALGTVPQQQTVADWVRGLSGANPLSTAVTKAVQGTAVDPKTFLPTANVVFKKATAGYRYEVVRVRMDGRPRPGVIRKAYAHNFHLTSPKGDNFIIPNGEGESIQSFAARSQADIVSNSTGWQTAAVSNQYALRGPQIMDGIIYRDFEPDSNRGRHCIGVRADGSHKPYRIEDGWTAQKMIDDGVVDTFSFGPLLVMNGAAQNVQALDWPSSLTDGRKSARTIIGWGSNHDIILITVVGVSADESGVGGNDMAALAYGEGCQDAILLDGGGSTQAFAGGSMYHPSSDNDQQREVGDALLLYARLTQTPDSSMTLGSEPITLNSGFVAQSADYIPGVIVRGGVVTMVGGVSPSGGALFPANTWITIGKVPDKARPRAQLGAGAIIPCSTGGDTPAKVQIRAFGEISINTPVETGYINLFNVSYSGW